MVLDMIGGQANDGADERAGELSDQLFEGIAGVAKALLSEIAVQPA
jgi:hypothetical protein